MLGNIGKIVWGASGWAMPSLGLVPYFVAAATVVLGLATGAAYFKGSEGKAAAIATERSACEIRIAEGAQASAEKLAAVLATIQAGEADEPKTPAEEKAACKKSKLCRGGGS